MEAGAPDVIGEAMRRLNDALARVNHACMALDESARALAEGGKPAEVSGAIAIVTKAAVQAQAERGKIEDALRYERGGDGVDLSAARDEVGRRLARLMRAQAVGDVPG
jgi:hypothetical protein